MRIIGHLDMDAFFAAVEELDHPQLKGLPIVVGANPDQGRGRGVVSTANYAARKYGIHSALPISTAWRLSEKARSRGEPPAVFLKVNYPRYKEISARIMDLVRRYSPLVEEAGIDEAYFDLSFAGSYTRAGEICRQIQREIREQEGLTASLGIGPNKLVAKIASDFDKPGGLTIVTPEDAEAFLEPLPARKIPGVGPKTEARLARQGIKTVKGLKRLSREELQRQFGKWGLALYDRVRGRHDAPLEEHDLPKSVGEQETFAADTLDLNFLCERLLVICQSVKERLAAAGFRGFRTVAVTVRFADFDTRSRAHTLEASTGSLAALKANALKLFLPFLDHRENPRRKLIRLLGVRVGKLEI
jgi:DNA polymerase IV (DinB-like DNA polymerase)